MTLVKIRYHLQKELDCDLELVGQLVPVDVGL